MTQVLAVVTLMLCLFGKFFAPDGKIERKDFFVASDPNVRIFVREVRLSNRNGARKVPILLLHGIRVPGVASFDLQVPNGSLAADLAAAGHRVFVMDARGYGKSTRPQEMEQPPEANQPLVRSAEVVSDIGAVVEIICQREKVEKVALLGWATGGHWAGFYASLRPNRVSHLIFDNSLHGGTIGHPTLGHGSSLEDPERPGAFNVKAFGAYRFNTADSFVAVWDKNIPLADKSEWRDPALVAAMQRAVIESDATAKTRTPNTFRSPSGAYEDTFYLALGRQFWDASLINAKTLILRSELDFWSRPEDVKRLEEQLVHAARVKAITIPNATHFVHLDRSERGRAQFLQEVKLFLSDVNN